MKRVTKQWIVVDDEGNAVGFIRPDSMALVESKRYPVNGYLVGAYGYETPSCSFIYLWFSSGDLILVNGLTL
jgi:hypothetical protein